MGTKSDFLPENNFKKPSARADGEQKRSYLLETVVNLHWNMTIHFCICDFVSGEIRRITITTRSVINEQVILLTNRDWWIMLLQSQKSLNFLWVTKWNNWVSGLNSCLINDAGRWKKVLPHKTDPSSALGGSEGLADKHCE